MRPGWSKPGVVSSGLCQTKKLIIMCIIIVNKRGMLSDAILKESNKANPDGAGLMFSVDNHIYMYKNLDGKKIIRAYKVAREEFPDVPMFLHFRISSSGEVDIPNCHPFRVNRETVLMHNGVLHDYTVYDSPVNDTRLFIKKVLSKIPQSQLFTSWMQALVEKAIGGGNKFVMLKRNGEWCIFNEKAGHWVDENWFSNYSYQTPMVRTKYSHPYFTYTVAKDGTVRIQDR